MGDQKFAKLAEVGLTEKQVHDDLMKMGIPELDAGLIADCLNVGKACSWQNNDPVVPEAVVAANAMIASKCIAMEVKLTPSRFDKYIWEVVKKR